MKKNMLLKKLFATILTLSLVMGSNAFNFVAYAENAEIQPDTNININENNEPVQDENTVITSDKKEEKREEQTEEQDVKYKKNVEFIGQWVDESSRKINEIRNFEKSTDKLGKPKANPGLLRGLAKTFLGWSDKPSVGNGQIADGAKLFSQEDIIAKVFPEGIPDDAKLYGVYFSLNDPDKPFDPYDILGFTSNITDQFKGSVNNNKVTINLNVTGEDTLPNTDLNKDMVDDTENTRTIIDVYKTKDLHEVFLQAEFNMDDTIAMLVYKNPIGSNALRPVLSYDYNKRYSKDGNFETGDEAAANYTYVDLHIDLDEKINVPEKLYMEFKGYSWRPLYALDNEKNILSIFNPNDESSLGNDKSSFASLVNNLDPRVKFGIETGGKRSITIRTVLREGDNEKIKEDSIVADNNGTVVDKILENMTLRVLSSAEIKDINKSLSEEEAKKRVISIIDEVAKNLSETNGEETLKISGNVKGYAVADAGKFQYSFFTLSLRSATTINEVSSNKIQLGYVKPAEEPTIPSDPIKPSDPTVPSEPEDKKPDDQPIDDEKDNNPEVSDQNDSKSNEGHDSRDNKGIKEDVSKINKEISDVPETGDKANFYLYTSLMVSLLIVTITMIFRKKLEK